MKYKPLRRAIRFLSLLNLLLNLWVNYSKAQIYLDRSPDTIPPRPCIIIKLP